MELFAADGHDAGGCERVTGKSGMRPVTLVCDNLNTHTKGAFYEVFDPARARELVRRIAFCYYHH